MAEKMRVHILAKELSVPSKVIVEKCRAEGINSVKNHMSTLSAGLHATICEWFSEGSHDTVVETAQRVDLEKVRIKRKRKRTATAEPTTEEGGVRGGEGRAKMEPEPGGVSTATVEAPTATATAEVSLADTSLKLEGSPAVTEKPESKPDLAVAEAPPGEVPVERPPEAETAASAPTETPTAAPQVEQPPTEAMPRTEPKDRAPVTPAGPQNVPAAARLQGPRVVRYEAPDHEAPPRSRGVDRPGPAADVLRPGAPEPLGPSELKKPVDRGHGRRKGRVSPRREAGRTVETGARLAEWRDRDLAERRERLAGATGRRIHRRQAVQSISSAAQRVALGPKTEATVHEPVRMKELCSATGLNFMQLLRVLREEHDILANINMTLPPETAELLAMHFGIELKVVPSKTLLDDLQDEFSRRERKHLKPRPPVVTLLGHVDHGKTSLLDAIRSTRVVAGEDGGITQHIGAYHLETPHGAVTFLDTPGHVAFTAMRARGAQMTDVVVLVIAADDGVMPQTVEAIHHAQAAEVPIVVALNKIDLGDQNILKTYGRLAEHGLTPSGEWGGEVDVIQTSATTGVGVTELVEHLADLSSLLDLKADPTLPASGTVIEAETKPGVGAVVRLLVQEGTLRVGDFVVCGPAFGKVRALLNDRGVRTAEVGPSHPVEVWGLDDVPAAGDKLYTVENLQRAKNIATEVKQTRIESGRMQSRKVKTLEEMFLRRDAEEVPELNVIIKADVDGSVAALRQALGEIPSEEVRLVIRHSGVGAANDSDILLTAACKGIVILFRVEASAGVRHLAEHHGVDLRSYRVIYNVCDDIKEALEGLLAPEERVEARATAEVRQLFRLSGKAGLVAGSYVTGGTFDRNHLAKVVRDGVVVREECRLASLRRFKDDVKEVRAGLECGIRLEGFDDIHVGDLIETYEIVKIARTL